MKTCSLIIILFTLLSKTYGQYDTLLIEKNNAPNRLTISFDQINHPPNFLDQNCKGTLAFTSGKRTVTYYIFSYNQADSLIFRELLMRRIAMEDCSVKRFKRYKNVFKNYFVKGNYYFLLEFCPCGGNTKYQCRKLSAKINNWLKKNKNCAQQRV